MSMSRSLKLFPHKVKTSICDVNVNNEQYITNVDHLISLSDHELLRVSSVDHVPNHSFDNVNHMEIGDDHFEVDGEVRSLLIQ